MSRERRRARVLRWDTPRSAPPKHPYRDSMVLYGVCAVIVVLVAWLSGGGFARGLVFAVVFFVVACGWSWWRWHQKLSRREADGGEDAAQ